MKALIKSIGVIFLMSLSLFGYSQIIVTSTDTSINYNCGMCGPDTVKLSVKIGDTINIINNVVTSDYFNVDTNGNTANSNLTSYIHDTLFIYKINANSESILTYIGSDSYDNLTVLFTVLKDSTVDTNKTGIDNISYNKINAEIFPNPVNGLVTISAPINITKIEIENLMGQIIYSGTYNNKKILLDLSKLTTGVYFIRINDTYVKKIVKE